MRKYCTPVRALPSPELVHVQHPRERRPVAVLEVDGAAVRREFLSIWYDERGAVGRPRDVESLIYHLEELLHEGRDGCRDFHRWRDARLVFNCCCLGGAASHTVCGHYMEQLSMVASVASDAV